MEKTNLLLVLTLLVWKNLKVQPHAPASALRFAHLACLCSALGFLAALSIEPQSTQAAVTEAWVQRSTNVAEKVAVDSSGNVVVTGSCSNGTNDDFYTAKYAAADGALLWEKRYNGPANHHDSAVAVALDGNGNVVVTGYSVASVWPTNAGDFYTAKYAAADGALLWEKRYNSPGDSEDYPVGLAVDSGGNVAVTGFSRTRSRIELNDEHYDCYTAKYAAADGAVLWEKRSTNRIASAVAADAGGNVVVTGYSVGSFYYTVKHAAADGALIWEQHSTNVNASLVAMDGSGDVVVAGYSHSSLSHDDFYTAKYAGLDGALLWEKPYNGPANYDDSALALAVDTSGNVAVTGYSASSPFSDGTYTAKYAAADGALLWEKPRNGPGINRELTTAVAVDGSGNVVVTGYSSNGTNSDYYTAKYAAVDGTLLWEKRYNGPANLYDMAYSIALGPNEMVAVTGNSSGNYATVIYWQNLPQVSIALVPTGVRLRFTGVPGRKYTIEHAPAVTGPWSTLATPNALPDGLIEYLDTNALAGSVFYRTSAP